MINYGGASPLSNKDTIFRKSTCRNSCSILAEIGGIGMTIEPLTIKIGGEQLVFLKKRLRQTMLPAALEMSDWDQGMSGDYFQKLISYWSTEFRWQQQEVKLDRFKNFQAVLGDFRVHFIYERGASSNSIPIILTHGWPDSFLRYTKVLPLLTKKRRFADGQEFSFDVVIPSLPGFGFSNYPAAVPAINNATIAALWQRLMTEELRYSKFIAAGGDLGSSISRYLAADNPANLLGLYLNDVGIIRELLAPQPDDQADLRVYQKKVQTWLRTEAAFMNLQATKPQTLAFALADSPAGLAAWLLEKFHAWSDSQTTWKLDELLTNVMLYWLGNSSATAGRLYYENAHQLKSLGKLTVPTGVCRLPADLLLPPKDWVAAHFNLIHWTKLSSGGHFTAWENPQEYATDLFDFTHKLKLL